MNDEYRDDYLWDKSGEPDPEIARLEKRLSRLRYKRPQHVPPVTLDAVAPQTRRTRTHYFAVAAAFIFAALAIGLWAAWQRNQSAGSTLQAVAAAGATSPRLRINSGSASEAVPRETQNGQSSQIASDSNNEQQPSFTSGRRTALRRREARNLSARNRAGGNRRDERREGEMAKEQLMMALQIASEKLSFAQKKIQANKSGGPAS